MPKLNVELTLKGLAVAYLLEAAVLYAATAVTAWSMISGEAKALLTDSALGVLTGAAAIWLTFGARAIVKHKRWARSAGVFWQLIQLTIALGTFEASVLGGLLITIPSVAVLLTLFNKQIVAATLETRD
jgi:hypothetical protein